MVDVRDIPNQATLEEDGVVHGLDLHIALHIRDARTKRGRSAPQRATRGCRHSCLLACLLGVDLGEALMGGLVCERAVLQAWYARRDGGLASDSPPGARAVLGLDTPSMRGKRPRNTTSTTLPWRTQTSRP